MRGLVNPLLDAGHQITLVTSFPELEISKNVRVVDVSHVKKIHKYMAASDLTKQTMSIVLDFGRNISLATIETPALRNLLVKESFDAVISEWFFSDIDSGYAAIQQAPWILLSGMVMHHHIEFLIDQVRSVPTIPALKMDVGIPMNFFERLSNTMSYLKTSYLFWARYPQQQSDYESQFYPLAQSRGVTLPPLLSAMHNISILFVNSHPSFASAQSLPPNAIDIAGYHIDPNIPPLPKDLQDLLDSSNQGVIYFSMGSVLKPSDIPERTNKNLFKIFQQLPYTVLWKYDGKVQNLPKNVHIKSWMPQSSILAHPNTKIFITHGGLLSTLESLYFGVPVIAIPVFGDQPSNAKRCERAGHALTVKYGPNMDQELKEKLNIMLNNNSYHNKAKYISKLFRNRPVSTTKLIQHYVELAIESKGALHLRSKTHLYAWYETWMLDQLALLVVTLYVIYRVFKKVQNLFKKNVKEKKKKH
ncbi:unnamed protein product, partial [Brenthis ino]